MVYLGADHGGFALKEKVKTWLMEGGFEFQDMGAQEEIAEDDYPVYAKAVCDQVLTNPLNRGILICRSGGGMIIAANKIRGIRAVYVFNEESAHQAREHNDANVISLADWADDEHSRSAIQTFLTTMFSEDERHTRRILMLENG